MRAANISKTIDDVLLAVLKTITIVLFMFLTFILTANVFVRFVPIASLHWLDEIVEMSFAGLVFYGAAAVWILKGHFSAGNWIEKRLKSARTRGLMHLLIDLLSLAFIAVFLFYSGDLVLQSMELSSVFLIPKKIFYLCMPISALIMTAYSVKYVVLDVIEIVKPEKT
jgi:TRAP-type C4-dicarboxylate transport system permease small subunit